MPGLDDSIEVTAGDRFGDVALTAAGVDGTDIRATFPVAALAGREPRRKRLRIRFAWTTAGEPYSDDVTGLDTTGAGRILYRRGLRFYVVHTDCDANLRLAVVVNPITLRMFAGRLARKVRPRRAR
jgi:hypothetical protein